MGATRLNREGRRRIAQSTLDVISTGRMNKHDISHLIESSRMGTVSYSERDKVPQPKVVRKPSSFSKVSPRTCSDISILNTTTLDAAYMLQKEDPGKKVAILNFASALYPGGGFLNGSKAQEESLALNTGLYACLKGDEMYSYHRSSKGMKDIYSDWVIYSPNVPVFRNEEDGSLRKEPWFCDIISCPCINLRRFKERQSDTLILSEGDIRFLLQKRMYRMMEVIAGHHDGNLVLGAWGCGVFGNNPHIVAQLFYETLQEKKFANLWPKIVFAVLDRANGDVITPFQDIFRSYAKPKIQKRIREAKKVESKAMSPKEMLSGAIGETSSRTSREKTTKTSRSKSKTISSARHLSTNDLRVLKQH